MLNSKLNDTQPSVTMFADRRLFSVRDTADSLALL